jgi:hypothetical protein
LEDFLKTRKRGATKNTKKRYVWGGTGKTKNKEEKIGHNLIRDVDKCQYENTREKRNGMRKTDRNRMKIQKRLTWR